MRSVLILIIGSAMLLACGKGGAGNAQSSDIFQQTNTMTAPDFPKGLEWLNTDRPLSLLDLRGKVVLLDFWTYCCINCMHIIPDLKRLEAEYPNELVVIGVHSAKFTQEGQTENIRQAVLRYEVKHPVVNDRNFIIWKSYAARAWPTVVLIDPDGKIVMTAAGEGVYGRFAEPIKRLVESFDKSGKLARTSLGLKLEASVEREQYLAYPGKILVAEYSPGNSRDEEAIFISDQNHNRIVVASLDGKQILTTIGSGDIGIADGSFDSAMFNHPQGMTLVGDVLYIADTENHAVRAANLATRQVTTLAGNGDQAMGWGATGGMGRDVALSSPWDVAHRDGTLYVAMAGTHQIWTIRLNDGYAEPFAGSSREALQDGPRLSAALAQPSGLTILGDRLYFADSEISAIRYVEIGREDGEVGTVVGLDLFEFGDKDGVGNAVRLQHPLGVTNDGKLLYVADTYNSKIKAIDPAKRSSTTVLGDGKPGLKDGKGSSARFYEPGGIQYSNGKLYIADTNNHRIRVADVETEEVTTLDIGAEAGGEEVEAERMVEATVGIGSGMISVTIETLAGTKLNPESQVTLTLTGDGGVARATKGVAVSYMPEGRRMFSLPVEWVAGKGEVAVDVDYVYCGEKDATLCWPGSAKLKAVVTVAKEEKKNGVALTVKGK